MLTIFRGVRQMLGMIEERPFHPDRRATLAGSVRVEIERRILAGELASGDKLNENALADRLGVSRGTVREAIRALTDSGLIQLVSNRGAFVRRPTVEEIANLYDIRGALFSMACAAAAERIAAGADPDLLTTLADNLDRTDQARIRRDSAGYYALNVAFHDTLVAAARNPRAKALYDGLVKEMHLFRQRGLADTRHKARSIREHRAIVAAIAQGDPEAARQAAHAHIQAGKKRFFSTLKEAASGAG